MKKRKMSRSTQLFICLGLVFTSGTPILYSEFPSMPDFLRDALEGLGIGLMIIGLVKQRRGDSGCARTIGSGKDNTTHEIPAD